MLKKLGLLIILVLFFFMPARVLAAAKTPPPPEFIKAKIIKINDEGSIINGDTKHPYQIITVQILDGVQKGKKLKIESGVKTTLTANQKVKAGETVILTKIRFPDGLMHYQVYDVYRINTLLYLSIAFVIAVILIAQWKGVGSLVGLFVSLAIIFLYIVPQILDGADPLWTSILGSMVILFITTYLAHGISKQTTVALVSTFAALLVTAALAVAFTAFTKITGLNEEAATLQFGPTSTINLKGLLLAGIIIGVLGALNDATTTQAAAVYELAKTETKLSFLKLTKKGYSIGREHIVSMVNTLVLAYAGSSLALFLFIALNPQKVPFWVIINSEDIADEIVRTLAGSFGLLLVVPIVTLLAAYTALRWRK